MPGVGVEYFLKQTTLTAVAPQLHPDSEVELWKLTTKF